MLIIGFRCGGACCRLLAICSKRLDGSGQEEVGVLKGGGGEAGLFRAEALHTIWKSQSNVRHLLSPGGGLIPLAYEHFGGPKTGQKPGFGPVLVQFWASKMGVHSGEWVLDQFLVTEMGVHSGEAKSKPLKQPPRT